MVGDLRSRFNAQVTEVLRPVRKAVVLRVELLRMELLGMELLLGMKLLARHAE